MRLKGLAKWGYPSGEFIYPNSMPLPGKRVPLAVRIVTDILSILFIAYAVFLFSAALPVNTTAQFHERMWRCSTDLGAIPSSRLGAMLICLRSKIP